MRKTYQILAWIVVGGVGVQAATIAFGFGGMMGYVNGGGVVDKALVESSQGAYTGDLGFPVHEIVGGLAIPLVALSMLVISFFAKVPRGRTWATVVFVLAVVQGQAGYLIKDLPYVGLFHGLNALALLVTALVAGRRARTSLESPAAVPSAEHVGA